MHVHTAKRVIWFVQSFTEACIKRAIQKRIKMPQYVGSQQYGWFVELYQDAQLHLCTTKIHQKKNRDAVLLTVKLTKQWGTKSVQWGGKDTNE